MLIDFVKKLEEELKKELPGENAQYKMAPKGRYAETLSKDSRGAKKSAVLILLFPEKDEICTVLIKRQKDGHYHSGQIALPGGKHEKNDNSIFHTAIREAYEEINLDTNSPKIIGQLSPLFIPVSNFIVFPVVAYVETKPNLKANVSEVDSIIFTSINNLFSNKKTEIFNQKDRVFEAPYFLVDENKVWGATAMILSELNHILQNI